MFFLLQLIFFGDRFGLKMWEFSDNWENESLGLVLVLIFNGLVVLIVLVVVEVSGVSFDHFLGDSVILDIEDLEFGGVVVRVVEPSDGDADFVMARFA